MNEKEKELKGKASEEKAEDKGMHSSVEDILKERMRLEEERQKLDAMIKEKYQRNVAIMFTDIKGSTKYFETYGDIEGRALIETHNRMLFPIISAHGGKVIKTIGDAIMAMFEKPDQAVLAGMEMQKALAEYNKTQDQKHKAIHIRIGLNYGPAVVESADVFGDAVNVAARVESKCEPDQVLISESLYQEVRQSEDILCRLFGEVEVKGKSEPVKLYRVIWSEEQLLAEEQYQQAGLRRAKEKRAGAEMVLELGLSKEGNKLKVSVMERRKGEERTVQQYQTIKVSEDAINQLCSKIVTLLNQANRRGRLSKELLKQLEEAGQSLYDQLLPREAKEKLQQSRAENLILRMDDHLVQIPWELLYNGAEFLCMRYNIGRIVSTRQRVSEAQARKVAHPLKMLVLADPRGDLPESAREGAILRNELDHYPDMVSVNIKSSKIDRNYVLSRIRDYDIIHYAGHADYDAKNPSESGWLIADGKLKAEEVSNLTGKKPMPALVFANGCQSGQTDAWTINENYENQIFGLANAFLVSGVQHYIGTFWEILDEPGREFAIAFYRELLDGASVGEAVRMARKHLIEKYGEETIVWASYMLYGDPSFTYLAQAMPKAEEREEAVREERYPAEMAVRGSSAEMVAQKSSGLGKWLGIGAIALILAVIGIWWVSKGVSVKVPEDAIAKAYSQLEKGDLKSAEAIFASLSEKRGDAKVRGYEGLAAVAFQRNDLASARDYAQKAMEMDQLAIYPHVIMGNIYYNQNDIANAEAEYRAAIQGVNGKPWMKSEAYNRLGRIASEKGDDQVAIQNYESAVKEDPANAEASINLGQKFLSLGNPAKAQSAFKAGASANPNDATLSMLLAESIRRTQEAEADKARAELINQEIADLVKRFKEGKMSAPKEEQDEWNSKPMTLALIDFETKGKMGLMEGEDDFLRLAITNALKETGRVRVVEREKLDKIISELNLSSSELASDETRLKLGKLLSARVIATGSIIRYQGKLQVSIRMIETETSEVKVALTSDPYPETASPGEVAKSLVEQLIQEVKKAYPLRGTIAQIAGDEIVLNIGSGVGLKPGTKLRVLEERKVTIGNKLSTTRIEAGTAEVTRAESELGYAKPVEVKNPFKVGMKVEEIVE